MTKDVREIVPGRQSVRAKAIFCCQHVSDLVCKSLIERGRSFKPIEALVPIQDLFFLY